MSFICNCSITAFACASFPHNSKGREFRRVSNLVMKLQLFGEIAVWHMLSVINGITLLILKLISLLFASWMTDFSFNEHLLLCTNGVVASLWSARENSASLCLVLAVPCEICRKQESQRWNYCLFLSPSNWQVSSWLVSLLQQTDPALLFLPCFQNSNWKNCLDVVHALHFTWKIGISILQLLGPGFLLSLTVPERI